MDKSQNKMDIKMRDGITGEEIKSRIFVGPCYYQRLAHMSSEKMYARRKGKHSDGGLYTEDLRQPNDGRSKHGGLRCGEQERDCILAHGSSLMIHDRMLQNSDKYAMHVRNMRKLCYIRRRYKHM